MHREQVKSPLMMEVPINDSKLQARVLMLQHKKHKMQLQPNPKIRQIQLQVELNQVLSYMHPLEEKAALPFETISQ